MAGLIGKRARFVEEYTIDMNVTQAAIRAGYSARSADTIGAKLLHNADVIKAIQNQVMVTSNKLDITREKVLSEIARVAFTDIRKFYNEDGSLKDMVELDEDSARALSSVESEEQFDVKGRHTGTIKKIRLWDKLKGLEMLAKHFKIYSDAPINAFQFNVNVTQEELKEAKLLFDEKY